MYLSFRTGFRIGLSVAGLIAIWLLYLWQPERQVRLHNQHLLDAIQDKSWAKVGDFIDESYQDQWRNDRPLLLVRLKEVLRYARNLRIDAMGVAVIVAPNESIWAARIRIDAEENEITAMIKERVNTLDAPFVFHWRHASAKPWDWKLTRVSNDELELPESSAY